MLVFQIPQPSLCGEHTTLFTVLPSTAYLVDKHELMILQVSDNPLSPHRRARSFCLPTLCPYHCVHSRDDRHYRFEGGDCRATGQTGPKGPQQENFCSWVTETVIIASIHDNNESVTQVS